MNINNPVVRCRVLDQYCMICWCEIANSIYCGDNQQNSIFRDYNINQCFRVILIKRELELNEIIFRKLLNCLPRVPSNNIKKFGIHQTNAMVGRGHYRHTMRHSLFHTFHYCHSTNRIKRCKQFSAWNVMNEVLRRWGLLIKQFTADFGSQLNTKSAWKILNNKWASYVTYDT